MNIYGKKVFLRAQELEDSTFVKEIFNDPEIEDKVGGWAFPVSEYSQRKWYESHYKEQEFRFVIETIEENKVIGIATLTDIDWKNRHAFHGIKLAKACDRGRGYGTDAVMAIMRYAFDELNLVRLDGAWFSDNLPSKCMYMKCGWKEEGVRRKYIYKHGSYRDLVLSGITVEDYYILIAEKKYWD